MTTGSGATRAMCETRSWMRPDTALGLIWYDICGKIDPDVRVAVVHRPEMDVAHSLDRIGRPPPGAMLGRLAERLWAVRGSHFTYSRIATYEGCASLVEYCTDKMLWFNRWKAADDTPLECDFDAYQRDAMANAAGIANVYGREWAR